MRLRWFAITLGALLVVLTYTFPLWGPLIQEQAPDAEAELLPGLPPDLRSTFAILPADQQAAYLAVAAQDPHKAISMVAAALSPGIAAPEREQDMPEMDSPTVIASGSFSRVDAVRWGQGDVTIYQQADNSRLMRFENFSVANGPELRVYLSVSPEPETAADMQPDEEQTPTEIGILKGTTGNQNYELSALIDLQAYGSVVIYSPALDMIYSVAPLFMRNP